jgi:TIR domain
VSELGTEASLTRAAQDQSDPPKIFISYRWSSPDHEEWVLRLASSLRASGVDVKLDKWHLKEGQDTLAFMESMVSDKSIKKVILICNKGYVERAESREGGVGTEAQIISAKVYNDTGQDKFAAVVVDLDENGAPLLPTYMSTRLYFDMSSQDAEATNFERLLRWIFDEPFHALPPIGKKPDFLEATYITGSPLFKIDSVSSVHSRRSASSVDAEAILNAIVVDAQELHLSLIGEDDQSLKVYTTIKNSRAVSENGYRAIRELVRMATGNTTDVIHKSFESLMTSWDQSPLNVQYSRWDNDAYHYFVHDMFVSFVAIAMQERAFDQAAEVLSMPFFKPKSHDTTGDAADYVSFRTYAESLEALGRERRRLSLHADLLNEGHEHSIVSQSAFMEADLTLHLRGILAPKLDWYPISALYLSSTYGALPSYVRAKSKRFYDRLKPLLMNLEADAIRSVLSDDQIKNAFLRFDYRTLDVARLIAAPELATSA